MNTMTFMFRQSYSRVLFAVCFSMILPSASILHADDQAPTNKKALRMWYRQYEGYPCASSTTTINGSDSAFAYYTLDPWESNAVFKQVVVNDSPIMTLDLLISNMSYKGLISIATHGIKSGPPVLEYYAYLSYLGVLPIILRF